jgi:hypothetical protein
MPNLRTRGFSPGKVMLGTTLLLLLVPCPGRADPILDQF